MNGTTGERGKCRDPRKRNDPINLLITTTPSNLLITTTPINLLITTTPIMLSPILLSPISLSPTMNSPLMLSPTINSPLTLSPTINRPITPSPTINRPISLSPTINRPIPLSPTINSPIPLSPTINSPLTLSPTINSPITLSPTINSPMPNNPFMLYNPIPCHPVLRNPIPALKALRFSRISLNMKPHPPFLLNQRKKSQSHFPSAMALLLQVQIFQVEDKPPLRQTYSTAAHLPHCEAPPPLPPKAKESKSCPRQTCSTAAQLPVAEAVPTPSQDVFPASSSKLSLRKPKHEISLQPNEASSSRALDDDDDDETSTPVSPVVIYSDEEDVQLVEGNPKHFGIYIPGETNPNAVGAELEEEVDEPQEVKVTRRNNKSNESEGAKKKALEKTLKKEREKAAKFFENLRGKSSNSSTKCSGKQNTSKKPVKSSTARKTRNSASDLSTQITSRLIEAYKNASAPIDEDALALEEAGLLPNGFTPLSPFFSSEAEELLELRERDEA
ncbi:hypothetical protein FOCC_FOCC013242 [Frankliniella occidentalis]|nr:hypothetical protein FOCC_FOCC013242 [Frankliniella occidentalis]